jgi:hypothetical protein
MKFHTVVIPRSTAKAAPANNPHLLTLVEEINKTRKEKVRVYQTYVTAGDKSYTFVTTSKDSLLGIGQLTKEGQVYLAKFLEHEFSKGTFGQLMLSIEKNEGDESSYTLVAMTKDAHETCFGFSPAH